MNNRHLYKAKRMDNGEWEQGFYVLCRGHHYILPVFDTDNGFDERYAEWVEVDSSTLCQCTGLTDKNGKLIWENDIVSGIAYSSTFTGYILWIDEIAGFGVRYYNKHREPTAWENSSILKNIQSGRKDEFAAKVIGNIFDNPKLLEVGE